MKNVTQTVPMRANTLASFEIPKELYAEYDAYFDAVRTQSPSAPTPTDSETEQSAKIATLKTALIEKLSKLKGYDQIVRLGVELPSDTVFLTGNLGNVLFGAWLGANPDPTSPLGKHAHAKRLQDLAERMERAELVLTATERLSISTTLGDDNLWTPPKKDEPPKRLGFTVSYEAKDADGKPEKRYMQLTPIGISVFGELLEAAVQAVSDPVETPKIEEKKKEMGA